MSLCIKTDNGFDKIASLGGNVISGSEMTHYKQEETVIGYWTDGKPLYRKIYVETLPESYDSLGHNIYFEDRDYYDTYFLSENNSFIKFTLSPDVMCSPINFIQNNALNAYYIRCNIQYSSTSGKLFAYIEANAAKYISGSTIHLELIYTKATDTPITNNNTYSTDEVLTGKTWIDGKPIYRKVYIDVEIVENWEVMISLTNIDNCINYNFGIFPNSSYSNSDHYFSSAYDNTKHGIVSEAAGAFKGFIVPYVTVEYTKTTD